MADSQGFELKIAFSADLGNTSAVFKNVHDQLTTSFGNLQNNVTATSGVIKSNVAQQSEETRKGANNINQSNNDIANSNASMVEKVQAGLGALQMAWGKLAMQIGAITAIYAVVRQLMSMVNEQREASESTEKLSKLMGIGLGEASIYAEAIEDIGLPMDALIRSQRLLIRAIGQDSKTLQKYGIDLKDSMGEWKNVGQLFTEVTTKYKELGDTTEGSTFANKVFGRSFTEIMPVVRLTSEVMEKAKQRAEEYNLILTVAQRDRLRAYKVAQEDANDVMQEFHKTVSFYILPILEEMFKGLEANRDVIKDIAEGVRGFLLVLITFGKMLAITFYMTQHVFEGVYFVIEGLMAKLAVRSSFIWRSIKGDATATLGAMEKEVEAINNRTQQNIDESGGNMVKKITDSVKGYVDMLDRMVDAENTLRGKGDKATKKGGDPREQDAIAKEMMARLAEEEQAIMADTIGKEEERRRRLLEIYKKYSVDLKGLISNDSEAYISTQAGLQSKINAIDEQMYQNRQQLEQQDIRNKLDLSLQEISFREEQAKRLLALGIKTEADTLIELRQALKEKKMAYLNYYNDLKLLSQNNSLELKKIKDDEALQLKKSLKDSFDLENTYLDKNKKLMNSMAKDFVGAFEQGFKGILSGTQSLTEGLSAIWNNLLNLFDEIIWGMVRQWILGEEAKTSASAFGFAMIESLGTMFHALMNALGWESTAETVAQEETKGTAKIWGEFGAFPPIAVALTGVLLGVLAGLALSSAKGGWDSVPFDGALAELHKGEMVLPQHLAERVRNMTEPQTSQNITYNINALDAQSFKQFAQRNKGTLFSANNSAIRDGFQYGVRSV